MNHELMNLCIQCLLCSLFAKTGFIEDVIFFRGAISKELAANNSALNIVGMVS